jgi:hypothetical protein
MRHADWIVDVGPDAGEQGGHVPTAARPTASRGPRPGPSLPLCGVEARKNAPRSPAGWLSSGHQPQLLTARRRPPPGVLTAVRGVGLWRGSREPGARRGWSRRGAWHRAGGRRKRRVTRPLGGTTGHRVRHGGDQAARVWTKPIGRTEEPSPPIPDFRPRASALASTRPRARAATTWALRSTWPRAAAKPAKAKVS